MHISSAEFEEVGDAAGFFEALIQIFALPTTFTFCQYSSRSSRICVDSGFEACCGARHAAVIPNNFSELAMEGIDGALAVDRQQLLRQSGCTQATALRTSGSFGFDFGQFVRREVIANGVGHDEIAVGKALHQRAGAEAIGSVIGEIRFADDEQSGDGAHQVVVDPQAAHRVVNRRIDPHGDFVGIFVGDALIHVEEVAVAFFDRFAAEPPDRIGEVEINAEAALADAAAFVADVLGVAGSDVARNQIAEARIAASPDNSRARIRGSDPGDACRLFSAEPRCGRRCAAIRSSA